MQIQFFDNFKGQIALVPISVFTHCLLCYCFLFSSELKMVFCIFVIFFFFFS